MNVFLFLVFSFFTFCPLVGAENWEELKGDHFIVFYDKGQGEFAKETLRKSEVYYNDIASDLGYARASNFWQWENRVKIFIYPDKESFQAVTGQPGWAVGNADYTNKQITSYSGSSQFLNSILPHELTHLIFRDFVGFQGEVPLWVDEGVAQWEEKPKRLVVKFIARQLYERKKLLSLQELTRTDIRVSQDSAAAKDFYVQAASLVGFLIEHYGADLFTALCRQLRDGKSLDEGLRFTYPTEIRSLKDLEERWLKTVADFKG